MKQRRIIELARRTLGTILLIIGIVGIFIPFFPDVILIIIGASLLGSKLINRRIAYFKRELKRAVKKEIAKNMKIIKKNFAFLRKFKRKKRKVQRIASKKSIRIYEDKLKTSLEKEREILYPRIFRNYRKNIYPRANI